MRNPFQILFLLFFFSFTSGQSLQDLKNLSTEELKELRDETISNAKSDKKIDDSDNQFPTSKTVKIDNSFSVPIDNSFFGYNFFEKSINFFDNIPTPVNFKLGSGDEIILSIWGETNSRESFVLNKDGEIYYSNIGFLNLSNKSLEEAELILIDKLSQIYSTLSNKKSQLKVELSKTKSINVFFTGQVSNPGIKIIHPFSDILSALVQAGGVNLNGSLREITLIRNGQVLDTYDFYKFFLFGDESIISNRLLEGDIIYVPPVIKRVKIEGSIVTPGFFELLPNESYKDLLIYASGYTYNAATTATLLQTISREGRASDDFAIKTFNLKIGSGTENISLNNGDIVIIPSISSVDSNISIIGQVKNPGEYQISDDFSLKGLLNIAGGFEDPVFAKSIFFREISILRKNTSTYLDEEFKISYDESENFKLVPGDKIIVYPNTNYLNSKYIFIEGEVKKPGSYQIKKGQNIRNIIEAAGGYTAFANQDMFNVTLDGVPIKNVFLESEVMNNMKISIPAIEKKILISGNVYFPGVYDISKTKTLTVNDAIELSGGLKKQTIKNRISVTSLNGFSYVPGFFEKKFKKLNYGDTIFVPQNESEFDYNQFVADFSTTLANLITIFLVIDRVNSN